MNQTTITTRGGRRRTLLPSMGENIVVTGVLKKEKKMTFLLAYSFAPAAAAVVGS